MGGIQQKFPPLGIWSYKSHELIWSQSFEDLFSAFVIANSRTGDSDKSWQYHNECNE